MAERATFAGAAGNEPNKYYATYVDKNGKSGAETVVMSADPAANPALSDEEACDAVRKHLIETRGDLYNRGVTWERLKVVKGGRVTAEDQQKISEFLAAMATGPDGKGGGAKVVK